GGVVQRLLAHPVAGEDETLGAGVPQRQPEHALERIDEVEPALLVEMRDDLGVAAGAEAMAGALEVLAEGAVVVDLPVAHNEHVAGLVGERLRAVLDVDDREAPAAEPPPSPDQQAVAVGTGVDQGLPHPAEHGRFGLEARAHHGAVDAAHQTCSRWGRDPVAARVAARGRYGRSVLDVPGMAARAIPHAGPGSKFPKRRQTRVVPPPHPPPPPLHLPAIPPPPVPPPPPD